jgi:ubiquinone/menaquinone biosynthesis C-methylase UbiE
MSEITHKKLSEEEAKQKEYYNSIAEDYDKHYSEKYSLKYRYNLFDYILKGIDLNGANVLDAMCGNGQNTQYFLNKGANVTGLDISEGQCALFAKRYPNTKIVCASILDTGFADNIFDFIISDSLHHLHPRVNEAINEIHRILKPGGKYMIWEPAAGSIMDYFRKLWYKTDNKYFEENEQSIDINKIKEDFSDKFDFLKIKYGGNIGYLLVHESIAFRIPINLIKYYAPVLLPIDRFIQKFQFRLISCWGITVVRKK